MRKLTNDDHGGSGGNGKAHHFPKETQATLRWWERNVVYFLGASIAYIIIVFHRPILSWIVRLWSSIRPLMKIFVLSTGTIAVFAGCGDASPSMPGEEGYHTPPQDFTEAPVDKDNPCTYQSHPLVWMEQTGDATTVVNTADNERGVALMNIRLHSCTDELVFFSAYSFSLLYFTERPVETENDEGLVLSDGKSLFAQFRLTDTEGAIVAGPTNFDRLAVNDVAGVIRVMTHTSKERRVSRDMPLTLTLSVDVGAVAAASISEFFFCQLLYPRILTTAYDHNGAVYDIKEGDAMPSVLIQVKRNAD